MCCVHWKSIFPNKNRYYETTNGILYNGDAVDMLQQMPDDSIDMVITSPPYDNLRLYTAKSDKDLNNLWNFEKFKVLAKELYRVIKKGGIVVWVVNDATIKGSETGTSFRQALYFKDVCGFKLHDTMIYHKPVVIYPMHNRYHQTFEYMFVFSKGKAKTFNPIFDRKNKCFGRIHKRKVERKKNGDLLYTKKDFITKEYGMRFNVWQYYTGKNHSYDVYEEEYVKKHPATFPQQLAYDHIYSWSNEGDIILDPLCGSGTSLKMAEKLKRKWMGIEISEEYCEITKKRLIDATTNR